MKDIIFVQKIPEPPANMVKQKVIAHGGFQVERLKKIAILCYDTQTVIVLLIIKHFFATVALQETQYILNSSEKMS